MAVVSKIITRADPVEAVYQKSGVSRVGSAGLVEQVIKELCDTLALGETVKLSGFSVFIV